MLRMTWQHHDCSGFYRDRSAQNCVFRVPADVEAGGMQLRHAEWWALAQPCHQQLTSAEAFTTNPKGMEFIRVPVFSYDVTQPEQDNDGLERMLAMGVQFGANVVQLLPAGVQAVALHVITGDVYSLSDELTQRLRLQAWLGIAVRVQQPN